MGHASIRSDGYGRNDTFTAGSGVRGSSHSA
jgi:hypothetical protein